MNRHRGFTLLELLVSLALFAVIYTVAYGTLANILAGSQTLSEEQQRWRQMDVLFTLLQEDLRFASDRKIRDIDGQLRPALVGQATDPRAVSLPSLEFSRSGLRVLEGSGETGSRRIAYRLTEKTVYRETWSSMDRKYDATPVSAPMLSGVSGFEVSFLGKDGQWLDAWPDINLAGPVLPLAVRVSLSPENGETVSRIFHVNG